MRPTYKVHSVNISTGESTLLFEGNENQARKFYDNYCLLDGEQIELSVNYSGSTTLIEWR